MKLVINRCFGGFGLSKAAVQRYAELQGRECHFFIHRRGDFNIEKFYPARADDDILWSAFDVADPNALTKEQRDEHYISTYDIQRNDPFLVQAVEELGEAANGRHADLAIVTIPDDVAWHIAEYDGNEHVAEDHRTWT